LLSSRNYRSFMAFWFNTCDFSIRRRITMQQGEGQRTWNQLPLRIGFCKYIAISTGLSQPSGNVPLWILMYFQGTGYVEKATPTRFILPQKVLGSTGIIGYTVCNIHNRYNII
jgi:hypothetical protein